MKEFLLFNAVDASGTQTSVPMPLGDLDRYAAEVEFSSGTLNGTLTLEAKIKDSSSWKTVLNSSQAVVSGASHLWSVDNGEYVFVRIKWVASSGTGTITANGVVKENRVKEG